MKIHLRLLQALLEEVRTDLARIHPFAYERVGFLTCGAAYSGDDLLLLGQQWHRVADDDYINDSRAGATIGGNAFRQVLQLIYSAPQTLIHVHVHDHSGPPRFSRTDERSIREFVPGFFNACPTYPHGALVLSQDSARGSLWLGQDSIPHAIERIDVVGVPLHRLGGS
jgi:hypothetical protein